MRWVAPGLTAVFFLASCTQVKDREVLDRIEALNQSPGSGEMRTDGYFWRPIESEENGKVWKGVQAITFLPGHYVRILPMVPAIYASQRDTASDTLNTFENAHLKLVGFLPLPGVRAGKSFLDDWGRYHADRDSLEIAVLSNGGIGFPILLQTIYTRQRKFGSRTDSSFALDSAVYRFRQLPQNMDSSGLLLNTPKFKRKRFPGFYWGF